MKNLACKFALFGLPAREEVTVLPCRWREPKVGILIFVRTGRPISVARSPRPPGGCSHSSHSESDEWGPGLLALVPQTPPAGPRQTQEEVEHKDRDLFPRQTGEICRRVGGVGRGCRVMGLDSLFREDCRHPAGFGEVAVGTWSRGRSVARRRGGGLGLRFRELGGFLAGLGEVVGLGGFVPFFGKFCWHSVGSKSTDGGEIGQRVSYFILFPLWLGDQKVGGMGMGDVLM